MSCPYQYYNDKEAYYPMLYCKINGRGCLYRKRCDKVQKYIPIDGDEGCYILLENTKKEIPQGSYYVRTHRQGANGREIIYVDVDNSVLKFVTNLTELNQNYVYLSNDYKTFSLTPIKEQQIEKVEPKIEEKKTKTTRKRKSEE